MRINGIPSDWRRILNIDFNSHYNHKVNDIKFDTNSDILYYSMGRPCYDAIKWELPVMAVLPGPLYNAAAVADLLHLTSADFDDFLKTIRTAPADEIMNNRHRLRMNSTAEASNMSIYLSSLGVRHLCKWLETRAEWRGIGRTILADFMMSYPESSHYRNRLPTLMLFWNPARDTVQVELGNTYDYIRMRYSQQQFIKMWLLPPSVNVDNRQDIKDIIVRKLNELTSYDDLDEFMIPFLNKIGHPPTDERTYQYTVHKIISLSAVPMTWAYYNEFVVLAATAWEQ